MVTMNTDIDRCDLEMVEALTQYLTPSIEKVADWHFTDAVLRNDWDRPLVSVLRFFVGDPELASPLGDDTTVKRRRSPASLRVEAAQPVEAQRLAAAA